MPFRRLVFITGRNKSAIGYFLTKLRLLAFSRASNSQIVKFLFFAGISNLPRKMIVSIATAMTRSLQKVSKPSTKRCFNRNFRLARVISARLYKLSGLPRQNFSADCRRRTQSGKGAHRELRRLRFALGSRRTALCIGTEMSGSRWYYLPERNGRCPEP